MSEAELKELFPDLEYKHPDCWFRLKREGNTLHFMVSLNDQYWDTITLTVMPDTDYFDIRMPVTLPQNKHNPFEESENDIL